MPRWLAARPRMMLPPPATMPSWMPRSCTSRTSSAMAETTFSSMPKGWLPISASPESLSRTRLKAGWFISSADLRRYLGREVARPLLDALAELEAREAAHLDVLADLRHLGGDEVADRLVGVLD